METNKAYKRLLKQVEILQSDLMDIQDYSEDVYQAFERLIEELEEVTEADQTDIIGLYQLTPPRGFVTVFRGGAIRAPSTLGYLFFGLEIFSRNLESQH